MKALILMAALCSASAAEPPYELVLAIYSASQGHQLSFRSYRDVIRVPGFATYDACVAAGDAAQARFESRKDSSTLSTDLLDYVCLKDSK